MWLVELDTNREPYAESPICSVSARASEKERGTLSIRENHNQIGLASVNHDQ